MLTQEELLAKVNAAIDALVYNAQPDALYEPIRYELSLGGKRIRPVLMLMGYQLFKDDVDKIIPQAIALETYHNFTLLHDDVMDRAEMRRGRPCVHKVWGDNAAILSGDAMLILAYRLMTEQRTSDTQQPHDRHLFSALQTFTEATLGVCEGQQYDIDFEKRSDVSVAEYMEMIRLKTSLLLGCALKMGALQMAYESQRRQLDEWLAAESFDPAEKISAVRAIYDAVGIRRVCEEKIESLFAQALNSLDTLSVDADLTGPLRDFAHHLMGRQS